MFFEDAFKTIRVSGGYIYRLSNPVYKIYLHNDTKTLKSNLNNKCEDDLDSSFNTSITFNELSADDWEVDHSGCWTYQ